MNARQVSSLYLSYISSLFCREGVTCRPEWPGPYYVSMVWSLRRLEEAVRQAHVTGVAAVVSHLAGQPSRSAREVLLTGVMASPSV